MSFAEKFFLSTTIESDNERLRLRFAYPAQRWSQRARPCGR
jgi:hypothetical protein